MGLELFFDMERKTVDTSAGPCELPLLQRDVSMVGLMMRVDPERARACLPPAFEPWEMFGKCTVGISAFEYRDSSIGPYNEFSIGIFVRRRGRSPSWLRFFRDPTLEENGGLYIVNLPVTTEFARAAGVEIWGFPKYLTQIETRFRPDSVHVRVAGELELDVGRRFGPKTPGVPFTSYTVKDGHVLRTVMPDEDTLSWGFTRSAAIRVLGDGPCARTVTTLGLDAHPAAVAFVTDHMRVVVPGGKDLGPA